MLCCKVRFLLYPVISVLILACSLLLSGCGEEAPVKIGFVGGLTGRVTDLGVAGRDGVIYAVEEINRAGGIAGRKIELIVRDDQQTPDSAKKVVQELIDNDVVGIVGPMTSSMGVVVKPVADAGQTVMVSPTVKTDQLSNQDDYFFRVTAPLTRNAEQIAVHATRKQGLQSFAVVYDVSNKAFTESWLNHFREALVEHDGDVVITAEFISQPDVRFLPIAERILKMDPDGVLLLSNAIDTAMIAQQLRKLGSNAPLFSSEWAFTTDLISFGGLAVNGITSYHSFNANGEEQKYTHFRDGFVKRFGYKPSFATTLAYDAATFLFKGLEKNPKRAGLKDALLKVGTFSGLQSRITVDKYGDVERHLFLTVVDNGDFKVLK